MGENYSKTTEIDRHDENLLEKVRQAPVYKKQGEVSVVIANGGEKLDTLTSDGMVETSNVADSGDVIVTNSSGEKYILKPDIFYPRYEAKPNSDSVFVAKGHCRAIDNPYETPISMMASWGEKQNGQPDCKIAETYDPETNTSGGELYIIGAKEFKQTYKPVE